MDIHEIKGLLQRWLSGTATDQEQRLVENWYREQLAQRKFRWSELEKERMREAIEAKLMAEINKKPVPVEIIRPARVRRQFWWAAAASVLIFFSAATYFFMNRQKATVEITSSAPQ